MKYFFDSYALIEQINNSPNYAPFANEEIVSSPLNVAEVYYYLLKIGGKALADEWYEEFNGVILSLDTDLLVNAMIFKLNNKQLSMVDAIGYALSLNEKLLFLTGDKEFKGMANVEFVK